MSRIGLKSLFGVILCGAVISVCLLAGCRADYADSETVVPELTTYAETTVITTDTENVGAETDTAGATEAVTEDDTADTPVKSSPEAPIFSVPGGIIKGKTSLTLTLPENAPEGAKITYTTDCREPTAKSTEVNGDITLPGGSDCTVIRAAVFDRDGKPWGGIATNVYMSRTETELRVISLVADPDDLYGKKSGILANRSETGREWERPCFVNVFEPDGTVTVSQYAGLRLAGAGSRSFNPASFRVTARKSDSLDPDGNKYAGGGSFKANLFGDSPATAYDSFLLRNGGNDAISQARSGFLRQTIARDAIANNVCAKLPGAVNAQVFAQLEVPVVVYLNGEYYGVLNMKQDFDEDLLKREYGIDDSFVSIIKGKKNGKEMWYKSESGSEKDIADWQALCAYAADNALKPDYENAYEYISSRLDTDNAAWYLAVMTYLCNTDWPQNNVMVWRYTGESCQTPYTDGKWRFVIRDMDLCFALHDKESQTSSTTYSMADTDTFDRILRFYWDGNGYEYDESTGLYADVMGIQGLYDFLLRSEKFRSKLRECADYLMSDAFAEICEKETNAYFDLLMPEMADFIKKWQAYGSVSEEMTYPIWLNSKKDILTFIGDRPKYYEQYLKNALKHYE